MVNVCGVDFGIFNFMVGWMCLQVGDFLLLLLEDGKVMLFLVVFFNVDENSFSYGCVGLGEYLVGYEGCLMCLLKSLFGFGVIDGQMEVGGWVLFYCGLFLQFIGEFK